MIPESVNVVGAGGHARSVVMLLKSLGYEIHRIMDESASPGETVMDIPVTVPVAIEEGSIVLAIGDNGLRSQYFERYESAVISENLIHSGAYLDSYAIVGRSNLIFNRCHIGPEAMIADNNIINTGSIVEHEAVIGSHTHISVGSIILGRARIGNRCMIGAGSVVRDGVSVCDEVLVGANSYVNEDIESPGVYVGSPVRRIS